jgi:hypothetical protein
LSKGEHKLDYAINHLGRERSRIATERDVALNNKDYDLANNLDWIVNGLDAAIKLLEDEKKKAES